MDNLEVGVGSAAAGDVSQGEIGSFAENRTVRCRAVLCPFTQPVLASRSLELGAEGPSACQDEAEDGAALCD